MKKIRLASILCGLFFFTTYPVAAQFSQPGELDTTFNFGRTLSAFTDSINTSPGKGANFVIQTQTLQPDGKILIGGFFFEYNGTSRNRIARLNIDGSLDPTFNQGSGLNGAVYSIVIQPDGKIIIGGAFDTYNGTSRNSIARLNSNGSLDTTFNPGSGPNSIVRAIALQPDGKIFIGGLFVNFNGIQRNHIARLNAAGSLDATFNPGFGANNNIHTIAIQPDGKLLVGGYFTAFNGTSRNRLARLNSNGNLDTSFNTGTGVNGGVETIKLQPNGKVLIGGLFTTYNGTIRNYIARANSNGSLDATFNSSTGANSSVDAISLQTDGKVLIGGTFISYNGTSRNRIARINSDGSLDATFNPGTGVVTWKVYTIVIQPNTKVLIGGDFTEYNNIKSNYLARLNTDGSLDPTFNPGTGADDWIYSVVPQPDGKLLIGGKFTTYINTSRRFIARLNSNGSLDTSFIPINGANNPIWCIALQPDGKVIIGGDFSSYNNVTRNCIARLNADGSLDTSFNPGTGANGRIYSIALQTNGKLIIAGWFSIFNGFSRNRIARLNPDGSLDSSFNPGSGANNWVQSLALQPDGKVLIGGDFTSFNGTTINRIARLNSNGSLDLSFNLGTAANSSVWFISVQPDGKVLISGGFTTFNNTQINRIVRINSNGSLDSSFDIGSGANNFIYSHSLQLDGKILIGGDFNSFNGVVRNRLSRLNADGSLDMSFNPGSGANSPIYSVSIQSDGKVLIVGFFNKYSGVGRPYLARLWGSNGALGTSNPKLNDGQKISIYPNPTQEYLTVESKEPFRYEWYSLTGKRLKISDLTSAQAELATDFLAPGTYILKIITSKGVETRKVVKE